MIQEGLCTLVTKTLFIINILLYFFSLLWSSPPCTSGLAPAQSKTSEVQVAPEKDQPRKNTHNTTREMEYITVQEFDGIPP